MPARAKTMNLWIGTSGFQYPEWKGMFYPEKIPAAKMLPFYAERFSTTEINYTFRQVPSARTIENWLASTPERFRFSLKAPQKMTHFARLRDCGEALAFFRDAVSALGGKLGPVLFQLPPNFKKDAAVLASFLTSLPAELRAAFEFRHESWFDEEVFGVLREHNAALCLAENEDLATPKVVTADFGYLRLRCEKYTARDLTAWAEFLRGQTSRWPEAFVYFMHEETGTGPKFAQQLMRLTDA
jgi:uncharacterized protein YecE (DUF72 family)